MQVHAFQTVQILESAETKSPTILDEFKFVLPDSLDGHKQGDLCIVVEVFHVKVKESTKRKKVRRSKLDNVV
jgi:hypothetical protein